jgi:hypothetical protein
MNMRSLLVVFVFATISRSIQAQQTTSAPLVRIPYRTYISINPLGIPFDLFSAEVESGIAQGMTLGASGSHIDVGDERFTSADFKFRYYPGEVVLRGFSVGGSVGMQRYSDIREAGVRETLDSPTFGVIVDYNWMLGARHRFIVGTGVGAKRILASSEDRERVGVDRAQATARFTMGIAF